LKQRLTPIDTDFPRKIIRVNPVLIVVSNKKLWHHKYEKDLFKIEQKRLRKGGDRLLSDEPKTETAISPIFSCRYFLFSVFCFVSDF